MSEAKTLYARLGGYDAISAVANNLVSRLMADARLGRFWANRGEDGVRREIQLLIDLLSNAAGGPVLYTGRDMKVFTKACASPKRTGPRSCYTSTRPWTTFRLLPPRRTQSWASSKAQKATSWKPKSTALYNPDRPHRGH